MSRVRAAAGALLLLAGAFPAAAQFTSLATTDDGAQVYFISSLREKGSAQLPHEKVFRIIETGEIQLFAQRERTEVAEDRFTNYFLPTHISMTGDGRSVVLARTHVCRYGGSGCLSELSHEMSQSLGAVPNQELRGRLELSRNGRFAVVWDSAMGWSDSVVTDLSTGETAAFPPQMLWRRAFVASDGSVVAGAHRWKAGEEPVLVGAPENTWPLALSDNGEWVGYAGEAPGVLHVGQRSTGQWFQFPDATQPSFSNDGSRLLFMRNGELWVSDPAGERQRQVTELGEGMRTAVLAGAGHIAWAVTGRGRLLKINVDTGDVHESIGPTVLPPPVTKAPVPGSALYLDAIDLTGFELTVEGVAAPVIAVSPEGSWFQIPWETRPGTASLRSATSPFEAVLAVQEFAPSLLPGANDEALVIAGDWSRTVTREDPAEPGSIVHVFGSGFGPVSPPIPTGQPAPADTLHRVLKPDACLPTSLGSTPEILFLGLAPGTVGMYQLDLRLPATAPPTPTDPKVGWISLQCGEQYLNTYIRLP